MKKLLSIPPNLVNTFHQITGLSTDEFFVTHDPINHKLGSGGGTTWLLQQFEAYQQQHGGGSDERKILLHAGGQSRRLPAYGPSGKVLTPIPCINGQRGQQIDQDLLALQLPLYEQIMEAAPSSLTTMIVSGDVLIRTDRPLLPIPDVDVVCYGLPLSAEKASHHGVFVSDKNAPQQLLYMLQKPSVEHYNAVAEQHQCLVDIGIWLLSDRAVELLRRRSCKDGKVCYYDLYTDFGGALGRTPRLEDAALNQLSVAILPLEGGSFYHFGTTEDVFNSMATLQQNTDSATESRQLVFIQHADVAVPQLEKHQSVWIENSCVGEGWALHDRHMITGVPQNDWKLELLDGQCVDIVPIDEHRFAVRPYGIADSFRGDLCSEETRFTGKRMQDWLDERQLKVDDIEGNTDMQSARLFPVVENKSEAGLVLRFMLNEPDLQHGKRLWNECERLSADELSTLANLPRLFRQRREFMSQRLPSLANDYLTNGFYQNDLHRMAQLFSQNHIDIPSALNDDAPLMDRISSSMFRSEILHNKGIDGSFEHDKAFALLREGLSADALQIRQRPCWIQEENQSVIKRNPVRIDIAGGWTDTPPFSLLEGGRVVNFSLSLDGELPIQTIVMPLQEPVIRLRSVDLHAEEQIETYEQLAAYNQVGSPFSIPKAALALAGFLPRFSAEHYESLHDQLLSFGCGISITMQSNVPAGSGLGTSSILAATVLDALNDFCSLGWDRQTVGSRTLVLEQLLTTGGGWQDQFGGLFSGVNLFQTTAGFNQVPTVRNLNPTIFTSTDYEPLHLVYFTGIQRTAKTILAEIVHRMFLNEHHQQSLLQSMKRHTLQMADAIDRADYREVGLLMRKTWQQNQLLDSGTNPRAVAQLTSLIDDLCYGYKSPGAGGGGFLYMMAKDLEAARRIETILRDNAINRQARLYTMKLT